MRDQDVITVHDTNHASQDDGNGDGSSTQRNMSAHNKSVKKAMSTKGKRKKQIKREEPVVKTLDEYKAEHYIMLSKLHEEVQPCLKEIGTRLNALGLERQPPKQKSKNKRRKKNIKENANPQFLLESGVAGKAGKSFKLAMCIVCTSRQSRPKESQSLYLVRWMYMDLQEKRITRVDESLMARGMGRHCNAGIIPV